jgi:hypothetical protein
MPASPNPRPVYGPSRPQPTVVDPSSPTWRDTTEHHGRTFVTITIGRNIHSTTADILPADEWEAFCRSVDRLFTVGEFVVVDGRSISTEHGTEETYVVGGWITFPTVARRQLAGILQTFRQDAAAWVEGGERITAADK